MIEDCRLYRFPFAGDFVSAWGFGSTIYAVALTDSVARESAGKLAPEVSSISPGNPGDPIHRTLERYLSGGGLDSKLNPSPLRGTKFQHLVWKTLQKLPPGELITYGELASQIGRPGAARAVGGAVGANPIPIFIPCHRVVASDGPGGFGGGLDIKARLLALEGLSLPE